MTTPELLETLTKNGLRILTATEKHRHPHMLSQWDFVLVGPNACRIELSDDIVSESEGAALRQFMDKYTKETNA